jgi:hypothetical protein
MPLIERSEPEVAAGGRVQCLRWADVALDEGGQASVPGLQRDPVQRDTSGGRGGRVPRAKRVPGDPFGTESGGSGAGPEHPGDQLRLQAPVVHEVDLTAEHLLGQLFELDEPE